MGLRDAALSLVDDNRGELQPIHIEAWKRGSVDEACARDLRRFPKMVRLCEL